MTPKILLQAQFVYGHKTGVRRLSLYCFNYCLYLQGEVLNLLGYSEQNRATVVPVLRINFGEMSSNSVL